MLPDEGVQRVPLVTDVRAVDLRGVSRIDEELGPSNPWMVDLLGELFCHRRLS
jgi:hypothetical protein